MKKREGERERSEARAKRNKRRNAVDRLREGVESAGRVCVCTGASLSE